MKPMGWLSLVVAVVLMALALWMDTTVPTMAGDRVHNIGLLSDQRNLLLVACALAVLGVILLVAARRSAAGPEVQMPALLADDRPCPRCAERIKKAATFCRYCGSDVPAVNPYGGPV